MTDITFSFIAFGVLMGLLFVAGPIVLLRLVFWLADEIDRRADAELRAEQMVLDAQLEADVAALERAWRMPDPAQRELFRAGDAGEGGR